MGQYKPDAKASELFGDIGAHSLAGLYFIGPGRLGLLSASFASESPRPQD